MKTKIIYISGNELFEMAQIRAAFEEVRNTLALDKDTVLFGVPVDNDDAIATTTDSDNIADVTETVTNPLESDVILDIASDNDLSDNDVPACDTPASSETDNTDDEQIVPIMSVLATSQTDNENIADDVTTENNVQDTAAEIVSDNTDEEIIIETVAETVVVEQDVASDDPDSETDSVTTVSQIADEDILDEEPPVTLAEKTLEELLESMTPLREDVINNDVSDDATATVTESDIPLSPDDTDATLEQLATEFVQNEDKITTTPKTETSGKIGKLKNILPFKKVKRDDSGIMGDLFGWAGIAANDEDFSVPGFFTAAKKQGA